jgi:transcriptional regulator with XRE-family HTH domain
MPNRTRPANEAARLASWQLNEVGREFRLARLSGGMRQADVARAARTSTARVSRVERGLVRSVSYSQLATLAGAVGLKLHLRAYPAGRRVLDAPQLGLLAELRMRAHASWSWETEVPIPIEGDLRAADARSTAGSCSVIYELWTRLSDFQAQTRAAQLKQRDLHATRLIIVLRASRTNRRALAEARDAALVAFPLGTRTVLAALAQGRDPGGNGIIFL